MTNHNTPRRMLDDAIDDAVRELVQADPRAGFRRRVIDRLNARPARLAWLPKVLIPATALAAILLAVVFLREPPQAPDAQVVATPSQPSQAAPPPSTPAPAPPVAEDRPAAPPRTAKRQEPAPAIFGPRSDRVAATSVQAGSAQRLNIRIDVTFTEHRDGVADAPRTLTLHVADRDRAQVQSSGNDGMRVSVSAQPEVVSDHQVRVALTVNYRGPRTETAPVPAMLTQTFASLVEHGKPLVVTQWTEAGTSRSVKVELKATIQK